MTLFLLTSEMCARPKRKLFPATPHYHRNVNVKKQTSQETLIHRFFLYIYIFISKDISFHPINYFACIYSFFILNSNIPLISHIQAQDHEQITNQQHRNSYNPFYNLLTTAQINSLITTSTATSFTSSSIRVISTSTIDLLTPWPMTTAQINSIITTSAATSFTSSPISTTFSFSSSSIGALSSSRTDQRNHLNLQSLSNLVESNIHSQEALTQQRNKIKKQYIELATSKQHGLIISSNLPDLKETNRNFTQYCEYLTDLLEIHIKHNQTQAFKFKMSLRSLQLIQGDPEIEHHSISSTESYGSYCYQNFPNIKQFILLLWNLALPSFDLTSFIQQTISIHCNTLEKWYQWRAPFLHDSRFQAILSYDDICYAFAKDQENNNIFLNSLVFSLKKDILPVQRSSQQIRMLLQAYHQYKIERLMPLIEALFMTMRGHNHELLNPNEPNRPSCAEGTYLNLMKATAEILQSSNFSNITLEMCA